jgi:S1-C subfamily serine protease
MDADRGPSLVAVFVVRADPNYAQPWQMRPQRSGTGSAFITDVDNRRIMTNAHVVRRPRQHARMYALSVVSNNRALAMRDACACELLSSVPSWVVSC